MAETKEKIGPYKGSKANGGRPIYVYKKKIGSKWVTISKRKLEAITSLRTANFRETRTLITRIIITVMTLKATYEL